MTTENINDNKAKKNNEKKQKIFSALLNAQTWETFNDSLELVKKEFGDFKITRLQRKQLAKDIGVEENEINTWQTVADVLDHIDIVELAKKHPEVVRKIIKGIAFIVGIFVPVVEKAVQTLDATSDKTLVKAVEIVGYITPTHIANKIAKKQAQKCKNTKELPSAEESENPSQE